MFAKAIRVALVSAFVAMAAAHSQCSSAPVEAPSLLQAKFERSREGNVHEQSPDQTPCSLSFPLLTDNIPRDDLTFENYSDRGSEGLFVHPPSKFAICLIEKNGCSTWLSSVLMPLVQGLPSSICVPGEDDCGKKLDFGLASKSQHQAGRAGMESIFHDPTATRAVFLRDPIERFVSAFLNKCFSKKDHGNCPIQSRKFRDAVEWAFTQFETYGPGTDLINGHWANQAAHCDLRHRIQGYNVIALMTTETFTADRNCVLKQAGLDAFIQYDSRPISPTTAVQSNLTTNQVLQRLLPPDIARKLIGTFLVMDYDLFKFPKEPDWLAEATGEWYDVDAAVHLDGTALGHLEDTKPTLDEFDIVHLAHLAGYA